MFTNYICALDIGSSKISAAVGEVKRNKIISLYLENIQSKAVRKGLIVDSVELVGNISKVLKALRARSGINIKFVTIGVSGQDLSVKHSHAVIPLSVRGGKAITASDIHKVNEQALILGAHLDDEVINYIPYQYSVDSEENILNPLGLYSHKLGVDLNLVCGKASSVQSLTLAVNQAGYEIKDLVFSGLATSEAVFTKELKNGINILCDVGSDITEVLIFNNGVLRNIEILQTGGDDITRALEEYLKIPFPLAEEIKISHGAIGESGDDVRHKEILLKHENRYSPVQQGVVLDIVNEKARILCRTLKESIEKNVSCRMANNFFVTGRTMLQDGLLELFESTMGVSVKLGKITDSDISSLVGRTAPSSPQHSLSYLTAVGILSWAFHKISPAPVFPSQDIKNPALRFIGKFRDIFQEYF